jgi:heme oxygenase
MPQIGCDVEAQARSLPPTSLAEDRPYMAAYVGWLLERRSGFCLLLGRAGEPSSENDALSTTTMTNATAAGSQPVENGVRQALRAGTAQAHRELEAKLDLISRVSDRQRFLEVLERFLGFHLVWERAIGQHAALRCLHESRSRLPHLRRDLSALGRTHAEQAAAPLCAAAAALAEQPGEAIGSLYVMEGSTLGGQVIGRALAQAGWAPPGGLTYFNPYQARTGEMWRAFGAWAEANVAEDQWQAAVTGANRTFAVLRSWMPA